MIHYPGRGKQGESYLDCAQKALHGDFGEGIEYAAFWDVDEFLILKQLDITVDDLLESHLKKKGMSSLSLNWHVFRQGGQNVYAPLPVTKRFVYREPTVDQHVKSMARLQDIDLTKPLHPHFPFLKSGKIRVDTNGNVVSDAFNPNGPENVAVIHHYLTKSYAEFVKKRERGRADSNTWNSVDREEGYDLLYKDAVDQFSEALQKYMQRSSTDADQNMDELGLIGQVYDDMAWTTMKRISPKYELYDLLG